MHIPSASLFHVPSITRPKHCYRKHCKVLARLQICSNIKWFFFFFLTFNAGHISGKGGWDVDLAQTAAQCYLWLLESLNKSCHPAASTFLCLFNWGNQRALLPAFCCAVWVVFGPERVTSDGPAECKHSSNLISSVASRPCCRNH